MRSWLKKGTLQTVHLLCVIKSAGMDCPLPLWFVIMLKRKLSQKGIIKKFSKLKALNWTLSLLFLSWGCFFLELEPLLDQYVLLRLHSSQSLDLEKIWQVFFLRKSTTLAFVFKSYKFRRFYYEMMQEPNCWPRRWAKLIASAAAPFSCTAQTALMYTTSHASARAITDRIHRDKIFKNTNSFFNANSRKNELYLSIDIYSENQLIKTNSCQYDFLIGGPILTFSVFLALFHVFESKNCCFESWKLKKKNLNWTGNSLCKRCRELFPAKKCLWQTVMNFM